MLVRSIRPSDLPVSFRVDTSSTAAADEFQRQAEDLDGVESAPLMYRPSVAQMLTTVRLCRQRGASFEVFMRVGASEQQLASTLAIMNALPGVTVVRVLNTDDAFVEFTKAFASQPDKLEGMRPEDLPMSIRFEGPKAADSMDRFRAAPGVESVEAPDAICVDVFRLLAEGQTEEQVAREVIERGWGEPT